MAKTPPSTAVQPPNSLISFTVPFATCLLSPNLFISLESFVLFSTVASKFIRVVAKVFKSAFSAGAVYVWFAAVSVSVVPAPARNGLLLFNAFPWRLSLAPEFAIELESEDFSVFVAWRPTVGFPFVVSSAGGCFSSFGFVFNFVVAVTNLACACDNSACVFALFKTVLASSKAAFNCFTLSSVLEAYFPLVNFPSISSINFVKAVLFRVSFSEFSSFEATAAAALSLVFSATGLACAFGATSSLLSIPNDLSVAVLFETDSLAWATAPAPKKILAPITTDAAPTLNFFIEYDSTFVPSFVFFK